MRRRDLLRTVGAFALAGTAGARPSGPGTASTTSPGSTGGGAGPGYAPLASLPIERAREAVVGSDGTTVFLAVEDGFAVADVAEPTEPVLLAERRGLLADDEEGPLRNVQDVSVDGDRLLVVGPAHAVAGPRAALLYDVREPADPARLSVHRTDYPIHNGVLRDGRAYLTATGEEDARLEVVDLRGEPSVLGSWSPADGSEAWAEVSPRLRPLHDLLIDGDLAYCCFWDAGTWIVDVSDPVEPRPLGRVGGRSPAELAAVEDPAIEAAELPGNHHSASVDESGGLLAVGHEAWDADGDGEGGPGGIDLVDVSSPGAAAVRSTIEPPATPDPAFGGVWTTVHNFELRGGHLYSAWYQGGVRVHDVSDPGDPQEVAAWRDSETTRFWTAQRGAGVVVASSMGTGNAGAGLFTFPDPAAGAGTGSRTGTDSGTGTTATGVSTTRPGTPTPRHVTATPGMAGFGPVAALVGAGLGALLARRRRG